MRLLPLLLALLPLPALAEPLLPGALAKSIKADPAAYLQLVSGMIAAWGSDDAITEDQLATAIAVTRAKARVAAETPLMAADLDGDGIVARDEVLAAEAAASATGRARLEASFVKADADGDGAVSAAELADLGQAAALAAYSPARMAALSVIMGFDADGDGRVTLAEVKAGLSGVLS